MPVYVYRCRLCGTEFEKLVLSVARADEGVVCPCCQGQEVERRPALFGLEHAPTARSAEGRCAPATGGG